MKKDPMTYTQRNVAPHTRQVKGLAMILCLSALLQCAKASAQGESIWSASQPLTETRAVWLTTIGGLDWPRYKNETDQKAELIKILDRLQQANINTVLLQTRVRGTVIYPSSIEPWDDCITGHSGKAATYDPLDFAVKECHKRGMEIHAWVVCIPLGKLQKQKALGGKSILKQKPQLCKTVKGECFMVAANPATAEYIAGLCAEIASRYDVDGIHLDYIRYPESSYGYNDSNLMPSRTTSKDEWRRDNITAIVRTVSQKVKSVKPWIKMSCSPIGKYKDLARYSSMNWNCYSAVYQDPAKWLREGYMDMLFPMMYFRGNHFYPFLYNWDELRQSKAVIPGLGIYFLDPREGKWSLNDVRAQIYTCRKTGIGGVAFYRSDFLTRDCKGLYETVQNEFFPYPAKTTKLAYTGDTTAPEPPATVCHDADTLAWTPCLDNTTGVLYNVYRSSEYPVDTSNPANLARARVQTTSIHLSGSMTSSMYYAVSASDRYGNESEATQENKRTTYKH